MRTNDLDLSEQQILTMVSAVNRMVPSNNALVILSSDSFGDYKMRVWAFYGANGGIIGTIERYWGGLKMICSVLGASPRTSFFTEDCKRTTNKGLKGQ